MTLLTCPTCGRPVPEAASACLYCNRPPDPAPAPDLEAAPALPAEAPFFRVTVAKFVAMSFGTLGLYQLYWCYRNWQRIARRTGEGLSPFWRAFFSVLWCFSLFGRIRDAAQEHQVPTWWSPAALAALYFVLTASWRLPDPWWLISLTSMLPFIPVVGALEAINAQTPSREGANATYSGGNVAAIAIGGLITVLAVVGTFLPE